MSASLTLTDLPVEVVSNIAAHIRPIAHTSTYPHARAQSLDVNALTFLSSKVTSDLLSLSYTCRKAYIAARPWLYFALPLVTTRQVRLLAQSLSQAYQPKSSGLERYNKSRQPRHLFMPNDGILLGKDSLSDQLAWAQSLRTLFGNACERLDSVLLGCRPDGAMLSEFLDPGVKATPRRLTILNFFSSPPFSLYSMRPFSRVTHIHFINLIPRDPIVKVLSGHGAEERHPIQVIRISQLQSEALQHFAEYIRWRRASELWDRQSSAERKRQFGPPERPRGPARRFEAQETLFALAMASTKMPSLSRFVLELGELARLPDPEDAPLPGRGTASEGSTESTGSFLTTNHAYEAPVAIQAAESEEQEIRELISDAERTRTAARDAYWIETRLGKEALQSLFEECRSGKAADSQSQGLGLEPDLASLTPLPHVEVRIVAPRPGGWNHNECRQDFESQVQACRVEELRKPQARGDDGYDDGTCFSDPDVFWLAEHRPWLSYDGARRSDFDPSKETDWRRPNGEGSWWTGSLPRYDAGRTAA